MATNKGFEPDINEETSKGIVLTSRRPLTDLENCRAPNENTAINNNELDTYFADEKIHIPDRVRPVQQIHCIYSKKLCVLSFTNPCYL